MKIFEDEFIVVAIKPQGMPIQPDKTGDLSFMESLNLTEGVINRLDRPVGGIVVFGKNKTAVANLTKQMTQGSIKKEYTAVVCGDAKDNKGQFVDFIRKNQRLNTSEVVSKDSKDAKKAVLNYEIVETIENDEFGRLSLVKIELLTGRHHQIRVQFANRNLPLWGDTKYNTYFMKRRGFTQISLISTKIAFKHPKNNKSMVFDIKPEGEGFGFFKGLQGEINNETN